MEIPTDIVASFGAVALTAALSWLRSPNRKFEQLSKRMDRVEKKLLILMVMLADRGFRMPDQGDTDRFLRSNNLEGI